MRCRRWILVIGGSWLLGPAFIVTSAAKGASEQAGSCSARATSHARVAAVGNRLELTLSDGRILRIAGIDPPGPTPADPELDSEARDWLAGWLANQEIVFTALDARPDRWGRVPAIVYAPSAAADAGLASAAESLLHEGWARVSPDQHKIPCAEGFLRAESAARAARRGIWKDPYYAVIPAADETAFEEHAGSFVLAEGRLTNVRDFSTRMELLFGPPARKSHLAVTIMQRNVKIFEAAGLHFHDLIGHTLRVRGLLEMRFGPEIELTDPSDVELLPNGAAQAADDTALPATRP